MQKALIYFTVLIVTLSLSHTGFAEEKGTVYFDLGVFSYEEQNYSDAVKNFKKAIEKNPENPFFHHYLGKTYLKMEQYKEAEHYLGIAWKRDSELADVTYDLGLAHYHGGKYSAATIMFAETLTKDPSHVLARYHMGVAAYKQKQYKQARDHFIKVSKANPSIKPNGYYYAGICHLQMGDSADAVEKLSWVVNNAESSSIKENAAKWLKIAEKQKKADIPYSLYAKLGFQYDNNVPLEPLDEDVYANKDDAGVAISLSAKYNFLRKNKITLGAGYDHYQTVNYELSQYNIVGLTPSLFAKYNLNPFTISLSYLPTYYFLESDGYMLQHQVKPGATWKINQNLFTRLSFSYFSNIHYINEDRDGQTMEIKTDIYYNLKDGKAILYGGIEYNKNSASHTDYDYGEIKPFMGVTYKAPFDLELAVSMDYNLKNYEHEDTSYLVQRDDKEMDAVISLSRVVKWEWLTMSLEYNYTNNDSNIPEYQYSRNMVSLSCIARY